jgi:Zn-dependent peptidase ImmA (M78 family)/transcriptional regulator with XRE-family HTH domain
MTLDNNRLGKRLAEARSIAGLTQEQAADHLAVPRTALVQIEAGRRSVSTLELAELAKLYRTPVGGFFAEGPVGDDDPLVALGRVTNELRDDPATDQSIRECVAIFREGATLEAELGRAHSLLPPSYATTARTHAESAAQGIAAADQERSRLGLGDAPIADMCRLISEQGIWATSARLVDGISGLFLNHPETGAAIVVNGGHAPARKRFSYAHEYAHALFDRERVATVTARTNAAELVERRANAFAAAFLMPQRGVEALLRSMRKGGPSRRTLVSYDVAGENRLEAEERAVPGSQALSYREAASLALHFGTSFVAACYRLRELNWVNKAELEAMLQQERLGRAYMVFTNREEDIEKAPGAATDDAEKELIGQMIPLILEAYAREVISRGKVRDLAAMLGLPEDKILRFAPG